MQYTERVPLEKDYSPLAPYGLAFASISPFSPALLNPGSMPWSSLTVLATKHRDVAGLEASDNTSIVREGFGGLFPLAVTQGSIIT